MGAPSASSSGTTPPATTPAPSQTSSAPGGKVAVDPNASLAVSPVDYGGKVVVLASFGKVSASRPVTLQQRSGAGWADVATGELNARGRVEFLAPGGNETFRAVALPWSGPKGKRYDAAATPAVAAANQWRNTLDSDFSGSSLPDPWDHRNLASYEAGGRQCSAPYASNVKVADGKVSLSMTEETSAKNIARAKAAGCTKGEYYRNAMISTENRFSIHTGLVAARVKFAEGQGAHGSVWLQSHTWSEIDFVESYGYGKGLTSVIHVNQKRYPSNGADAYVNTEAVRDRDWWKQYHVYSVEWDRSSLVFRIDGVVTQRIEKRTPNAAYFLVISELSSDWELKRLTDPVRRADGVGVTTLPQSMSVDWVKVWTRR